MAPLTGAQRGETIMNTPKITNEEEARLMKKVVNLLPLKQLALILHEPTGIYYSNQAGGMMCYHPETEGVLVFVGDRFDRLYDKLSHSYFHLYDDTDGLKKEDADYLDSIFMRKAKYLRVDRSKLEESMEAWIHVVFEPGFPKIERDIHSMFSGLSPFCSGFDCKSGILTWDNSD